MECIWLSKGAKLHSEVSQLVDLLFSSVSFGQREPFCGCGFVSLLWLRHIIKHRPCLQREPTFRAHVCELAGFSACITNAASVLFLRSSLVGSHIACEGKSYCITLLASGLSSLPLVTLMAASAHHDCFIAISKHVWNLVAIIIIIINVHTLLLLLLMLSYCQEDWRVFANGKMFLNN